MNCDEFNESCLAYLDGELDSVQAAQAQAHVRSCDNCRAVQEADQRLKASLARVFSRTPLPAGLAQRVFPAIDDGAPARDDWTAGDVRAAPDVWAARVIPLGLITAAAACLMLWIGYPHLASPNAAIDRPLAQGPLQLVSAIQELHRGCSQMGHKHHCSQLPRHNMGTLTRRMSDELELEIVALPEMADGLSFVGADYCRLMGARVAHLMYEKTPDRTPLSVISVASFRDRFRCCQDTERHGKHYNVIETGGTAIVAWHEQEQATYILCARMSSDQLLALAEPVRIALNTGPTPEFPAEIGWGQTNRLASIGWNRRFAPPIQP